MHSIVGALHLFGGHIDGLSLIAVLLVVGVTVDYTSHVSYHYFVDQLEADATDEQSVERLR